MYSHTINAILAVMVMTFVVQSCASNPGQAAYDRCMKETIPDFADKGSPYEARMTAHFICQFKTAHLDDHYYDCLSIAVKKFSSDGLGNPRSPAEQVCKHYARACKESPRNPVCRKGYVGEEYQRNPNGPYPGANLRRAEAGNTLLIDLAGSGDVDAVEAVIKRGADVNESMGGNWTPLATAQSARDQAMVEMLKRYGAK